MESCNNNLYAASDGAQDKKVRVRVLGRGTGSKNKLQLSLQADHRRKPTNAVAKRLGRQMGAAHRKCTPVEPNCWDLAIGNWNVSSLTGKEQELVCEAQQYRLDVGISSTKRQGSETVELNGGWKLFYSGVDAAMFAQASVGLLVSPNIAECVVDWVPLGGRVCLLKLRLQERSLCILQVYTPNMESHYEVFWRKLKLHWEEQLHQNPLSFWAISMHMWAFKYLGVSFTSDGRQNSELDIRIRKASAVMRQLHRSVVLKRELCTKAKLSIFRLVYVPILTYGHECWILNEKVRSRV